MKKILLLLSAPFFSAAIFAQTPSQAAAAKAKEMQATIVELLAKAANNFEGMSGAEAVKQENFTMYNATAFSKMYAQNYYITYVNASKRNYYLSYYTDPQAIQFAKAAIMDMPKFGGDDWKIEPVKGDDNTVKISYLYYKGARVGQLRDDLGAKSFAISVGWFDNAATPTTKTATPAEPTKSANAESTKIKDIQSAIAELVAKASTNFESLKGTEKGSSLYATMYNTNALPKLNAQGNYINYCKANGKNYFMAYYLLPTEELDVVISAIISMPKYGDGKWTFEQVKTEDKFVDESKFVTLGYLHRNGVCVAELRRNIVDGPGVYNYYLLSIGLFDKKPQTASTKSSLYQSITQPREKYRLSQHLSVSGNIVSVKNRGPKFDGDYDVTKLATDSCVSGNCSNGNGRKVLASITNGLPHIRIMEGKFRNNVFLGNGDMLIDGESPVVDGTYELGKFKVSYTHNTLQASAVFHPSDFDEVIQGEFSGYLDDGIGKALPSYQKFVVCQFRPAADDKNKEASKWRKEIYSQDYDLASVFWLTKEFEQAYAKIKAIEYKPDYSNSASSSPTQTRGPRLQSLNIRRTCSACGGTGKIYHNVTEYSYSGSSRIATSRRVPETCGACHGTGFL